MYMSLPQPKSVTLWIGKGTSPSTESVKQKTPALADCCMYAPGTILGSSRALKELSSFLTNNGWSVRALGPDPSSKLLEETPGYYLVLHRAIAGWTIFPFLSLT